MSTEEYIRPKRLLNAIVDNLIEERVFAGTKCDNDSKIERELISLSNTIRERMTSDQDLFVRYEELSTMIENSSLSAAYRQGFHDGIKLFREMFFEV